MARVRSIRESSGATSVHPTEVDAEIRRVTAPDGTALLQLSTFGSDQRASSPKVSQTLQFDQAAASTLRSLIDQYFDLN